MRGRARVRTELPAADAAVYGHLAAMQLYPAWVRDLRRVDGLGPHRRIWRMKGPRGRMDWIVEVTVEEPNRRFGYSIQGPGLSGFTLVRLRGAGRTTALWVLQEWQAEGPDARALASWWGDPVRRLREDLWRLGRRVHEPDASRGSAQGSSDLTKSLSRPSSTSLFSNW